MLKNIFFIGLYSLFCFSGYSQNLIRNGSFEEGRLYWSNWTPINMPAGFIFEISNDYNNYGINHPPHGRAFVEVDIESNFSQIVATVPGENYILRFAITRRYNCGGDRQFKVVINDKEVFSKLVNTSVFSKEFEYQQVEYHATGNKTSIGFYMVGYSGQGPTLGVMMDDVSFFKKDNSVTTNEYINIKGIVRDKETGIPLKAKITYEWKEKGGGYTWSDSLTGEYKMIGFASEAITIEVMKKGYFLYQAILTLKEKNNYEHRVDLIPMKEGTKIILKNVLFDQSQYILKDSSRYELDNLAKFMHENLFVEIRLIGHTDNVGDEQANKQLSLNRVKEARKYLIEKGIPVKRIKYTGMGEAQPIEDNNDPGRRHLNRRVEIEILKF